MRPYNNLAHHSSSIHYHHIAAVSSHVLYRKSHLASFTIYVTALAVLLPTLLLHSYYARADTLPDGTIYWITSSTSPDAPVQSQHVTACQNNTVTATPLNQTYIDGM